MFYAISGHVVSVLTNKKPRALYTAVSFVLEISEEAYPLSLNWGVNPGQVHMPITHQPLRSPIENLEICRTDHWSSRPGAAR